MIYWREIPFVKISLALITGILLKEWGANWNILIMGSLIGICICLICLKGDEIRIKAVSSFLLLSCISFIGFMLLTLSDNRLDKRHFEKITASDQALEGLGFIENAGTTGTGKQKLEVSLTNCKGPDQSFLPCSGKLIMYIAEENLIENPGYGDEIIFSGNLQAIDRPANPHAFDFQKYMQRKGIFHQLYINENGIQKTGEISGSYIYRKAQELRSACLKILSQRMTGEAEKGVASALLLGYKEWLSDQVKSEYTQTGATHVLAVSGLHTGIIAGMILWLFGRFKRNTATFRFTQCLFAILALWSFAILTGLSPSVMRATTMFSFVLVAKLLLKKKVNIINVISLSAFLLLLYNPQSLFEVGFQLSYSALLGIICFQGWIYRAVYMPAAGLKVWNLMSVSIAAQLGTLPFTLFYFHQFPLYFWLSGLIVVPLAGVIMLLAIATIIMNFLPDYLAVIPAYLLEFSTWTMNKSVEWTAQLPGFKTDGIWINFTQAVFLLACIILLARSIQPWKSLYLKLSLTCFAVFLSLYIADDFQKSIQNKMVLYQVKKGILIDYYEGRNCICITDLDTTSKAYSMAVSGNRIAHKIMGCKIVHPEDEWVSSLASYRDGILHFNPNKHEVSTKVYSSSIEEEFKHVKDQAFEIDLKSQSGRISLRNEASENYLAGK